jgi:hypothetical protein
MACILGAIKNTEQKMTKKTLAELNEIVLELEDNGLFREADVLHHEFVKMSQVSLGEPKTFKEMLNAYAPTFLKLAKVYPTRVKGFSVPLITSESNSENIRFVQELLLSSAYVKDKSGLQANGNFGPNTMRVMDDLRRLLNKILFDAYAAKYKIKDDKGSNLTIEKSENYF